MTTRTATQLDGVDLRGPLLPGYDEILTPEAIAFLAQLHRAFDPTRRELLERRIERQSIIDAGAMPDFLPETRSVREGEWTIAPIPDELQDRRVEITGPVERKMIINAMNSGAKVFMADFEDSNAPTWANCIQGQINLRDAVRRTITYTSPEGKPYQLIDHPAVLFVRPRGWHLIEKHFVVDDQPMSGSLFDFGLYVFHNAKALMDRHSAPYFYLPKLQSHLEARLWNNVFVHVQHALGIPRGTIKATVLIEHVLAAFETEEILRELRDHSAGLNCGRWDYIFSFIKTFRNRPEFVLPDRAQVTMTAPFMRSYCLQVIKTCHQRGAHAMGGMAAWIPNKEDPVLNDSAIANVRADKEREVGDGHDGTWVAHPGLVPVALDVFNRKMPQPNQISRRRDDVHITAADLVAVPRGEITETGLRTNIRVGFQYLEAWLGGNGCVPLYHLMEDAATAEICRTQIWQWIKHPTGVLADGRRINRELFWQILHEEANRIREAIGEKRFDTGHFRLAGDLFDRFSTAPEMVEFLTAPAYEHLD
ncbi:MAG: malate synthase A [Planctomycetota bacterium]